MLITPSSPLNKLKKEYGGERGEGRGGKGVLKVGKTKGSCSSEYRSEKDERE